MDKIAIISDIHGNLEALKATLTDIEKRKVDKIICLGDIIAKGVHPKECVELVKENCEIKNFLDNKIDIVLELPFIFGTQSADTFADISLKILNNFHKVLTNLEGTYTIEKKTHPWHRADLFDDSL